MCHVTKQVINSSYDELNVLYDTLHVQCKQTINDTWHLSQTVCYAIHVNCDLKTNNLPNGISFCNIGQFFNSKLELFNPSPLENANKFYIAFKNWISHSGHTIIFLISPTPLKWKDGKKIPKSSNSHP